MIYPAGALLIADNISDENLEMIKRFIRDKMLTSDDVGIYKRDGLLQLRTKQEVKYG